MVLDNIENAEYDKLAKSADKKSEKFTKCFQYGTTVKPSDVAKFFLVFFSVLADLGAEAVDAFLHANSLTYRVPFAAIMGTATVMRTPQLKASSLVALHV